MRLSNGVQRAATWTCCKAQAIDTSLMATIWVMPTKRLGGSLRHGRAHFIDDGFDKFRIVGFRHHADDRFST